MGDVIDAMIFVARSCAGGVFLFAMKSRPQSAVTYAKTQQEHLIRRDGRNTERIVLKDEFVVSLAVDESSEESGPLRIVEVHQLAQLDVVAQRLAQEFLIVVIRVLRAARLRAIGSHLNLR